MAIYMPAGPAEVEVLAYETANPIFVAADLLSQACLLYTSRKFLSVAELAYCWRILDRETFLALWIVLFALLGFYLLGKIKFPHDDDDTTVSYTHLYSI